MLGRTGWTVVLALGLVGCDLRESRFSTEATWLYEGERNLHGYALAGDTLYFSEHTTLRALDLASGESRVLFERGDWPRDLATNGETLMWREDDAIWGVVLDGGLPVELDPDGYGLRPTASGYGWFSGDDWVQATADLSRIEPTRVWFWTDWIGTLDADPDTDHSRRLKAVVGDTLYFTTTRTGELGLVEDRSLWRARVDGLAIPELVHGSGPDGTLRRWGNVRDTAFGLVADSDLVTPPSLAVHDAALWVYGDDGALPATLLPTSVDEWQVHDGFLYYGRGFALRRWRPTSGVEEVFLGLMDIRQVFFHGDDVIVASAFGFKALPASRFEPGPPSD